MTNYSGNKTELLPLKKSPLYEQVKKALRVYMSNTSSENLPTENELQRMFNVSRITIRRALKELEEEGKLQSVQGSGRVIVRSRKILKTGYIGIVQGPNPEQYQQEILQAADICLKRYRITTALNIIDPKSDDVMERLMLFASKVDGLIFCNFTIKSDDVYAAMKEYLPRCVVLRDPPEKDYPMNSVQEDRVMAFEKIASHLKELGHENIAFIGSVKPNGPRMEGIRRGLGRDLDPELAISSPGWRHNAYTATEELLSRKKYFSAVICNSDTCALGVMEKLLEKGVRIPEDVSVTGYDNIIDSVNYPISLTTAGAERTKLVEKAIDLIFRNSIENPDFPVKTLIEPELKIRASTGKIEGRTF
ncbi:MAG: hypothetical protein A2017_00135 [Lentisphaerae bacterium GWF2_44_16]|nr:MAG: hypothetical protein A2017_00135 [Lentisphaerae bacterium GWF2_44_16]